MKKRLIKIQLIGLTILIFGVATISLYAVPVHGIDGIAKNAFNLHAPLKGLFHGTNAIKASGAFSKSIGYSKAYQGIRPGYRTPVSGKFTNQAKYRNPAIRPQVNPMKPMNRPGIYSKPIHTAPGYRPNRTVPRPIPPYYNNRPGPIHRAYRPGYPYPYQWDDDEWFFYGLFSGVALTPLFVNQPVYQPYPVYYSVPPIPPGRPAGVVVETSRYNAEEYNPGYEYYGPEPDLSNESMEYNSAPDIPEYQ